MECLIPSPFYTTETLGAAHILLQFDRRKLDIVLPLKKHFSKAEGRGICCNIKVRWSFLSLTSNTSYRHKKIAVLHLAIQSKTCDLTEAQNELLWKKSKFSQNLENPQTHSYIFNNPVSDSPKQVLSYTCLKDSLISNCTYTNLIYTTIRSNVFP